MSGYPSADHVPVKNSPGQNQPGGRMTRHQVIVRLAKIRWWRKRIRHYMETMEKRFNYVESNQPISKAELARPSSTLSGPNPIHPT